ncbi:MAG: MMPL family transporter [Nitrospira sp.]|nr:RND family transporter [Candidatus Manganitrophaceae bacterium]HIL35724.1 RND family transporter [Candidatus Manganitrophaceae bacterium]
MDGKRLGEWVIRFRWLIIVGTLAIAMAAGSGGRFLAFSTDYRVFFGKDNPQLQAFERLQDTYTKNDNVLFAIASNDGKVFTRETLSVVEALTKDAWQVPYSLRVDSITNFQHTWADGDELIVEDLVKNAASLSDSDLERIKKVALAEPLLVNRNITSATDVTGVNVTINLPGKSMDEVPEVVAFVRDMARKIEAEHPEIKVYLSGMVMMNNSFSEASQDDMSTLMPIMYLVLIIAMGMMLRSFSGTLATVMVIGLSAFTAMGLAGWAGILFTPPSASAPTIILTLAVADSVHFLVTMFQEMRRGKTKREAIIESMRINLLPIFLTSLSTAIGFLSMNTSDSPPFHDLGNMVATGVVAAFFYSIFFLPAMMAVLPVRVKGQGKNSKLFMDRFGNFVVNRRRPIFWAMLAITLLFISSVPLNRFNDQFVNYFDDRYAFRTDTDFIVDHLTGIYLIEYSLDSGEEGGVSNPEYLKTLEAFGEWYKQQARVLHVSTLTEIMKRLNKNMHGDDPSYYKIPENRELSAQYLLLYEMSLPYGLDLNNQINVRKSATRFSVTLESVTTNEMLELEERAQQWLRENAIPSMQVPGASTTIMFSHISERNTNNMMFGTALALVLISGILIFSLRDMKIGIMSLIPNLVPAGMAFGLWGLMVGEIGMGTSIVVGMSLGIVVDDTVHFLSKYIRAKREHGMNSQDAVRYAFHNVGTALWVTSLILAAGFSVLTFSGFLMNSQMGLLTAITIAFALAADFLLLPPLLMIMERNKPEKALSPVKEPDTEGTV